MKKYLICLGLGHNQFKLIKYLSYDYNIIGIDRVLPKCVKNHIKIFFKSSIYSLKEINNIVKKIKEKKIEIYSIIYRSSGPAILSAEFLEKKFQIKRINSNLKNSIYSKSYFSNFLKKNKIKPLVSKKIKNYQSLKKNNYILKPDAPIFGKKNVFKIKDKIIVANFKKCKLESHNDKVNVSNFYEGRDVSTFYLVNNLNKKISLLSHIEEFNGFKKGKLYSYGLCVPPIMNDKQLMRKKEKIDKSIVKLFKGFYGIISISSKILKNQSILPYEINIGLSGDKYADHIFPYIFKNNSLYKVEIDMVLFKTQKHTISQSKKFIGFFKNKKIFSKSFFLKKIKKIVNLI